MLADLLGLPSQVATIAGGVIAVGLVVASRTKRFRSERADRTTVHDVVVGIPAKYIDGIEVEPAKPGLVGRVAAIETHLVAMDDRLTPNGLNTNNPGDVMGRTEQKMDEQARLLGIVMLHLGIKADDE